MRKTGTIVKWNKRKAYGFLSPKNGDKQLFVHINAFGGSGDVPTVGDVISYTMSKDRQGRPCAGDVKFESRETGLKLPLRLPRFAIYFPIVLLATVGGFAVFGDAQNNLLILYSTMSLITFLAYALDKSAARRGRWRTSEKTLLLLGLACGWPGALLAQQKLRHKSQKASFRIQFWLTVVLNCGAVAYLLSTGQSIT